MKRKKKRRNTPPTPEQLQKQEQRKLSKRILTTFTGAGFISIKTKDVELEFNGGRTEIDQMFLCEGCIVLIEETITKKNRDIHDHLRKKVLFHQKARADEKGFIAYLRTTFPDLHSFLGESDGSGVKINFIYAHRYPFDSEGRPEYSHVRFLKNEYLKHFAHLVRTISKSARFEIYKFLELNLQDVYPDSHSTEAKFDGFILPAARSGFGNDLKVVTFHMDPASLTELAYSLRRDSWIDAEGLYQRMLDASKIKKMRRYLKNERHVYLNNIIVGLPRGVSVTTSDGKDALQENTNKVLAVTIHLPREFNSVGIIDGQHRVYSYHEGTDEYDPEIRKKRTKQQLLVTGIIFPGSLSASDRLVREAKIFLEINAEQTSAKSELKHAIATIVNPLSDVALAKSVVSMLARKGPLQGLLHDHYYDEGFIKTSSIISYGLKYLVSINDPADSNTFYNRWTEASKANICSNVELRDRYVTYCASFLERVFSGFYANVAVDLKDHANKESRAYSVTMINGILYCVRRLLQENIAKSDVHYYKLAFAKHGLDIRKGKFRWKSSQWKSLGDVLAKRCFDLEPVG